jgi:lysyl-tRNA synthetase class 1
MGGMNPSSTNDWLDQLVANVQQQYPSGEVIVSSGHSPSGTYHIGTLREVMTANAITWALRQAGRQARHVDFVDDFDAFRKVPKFVPEEWSKYLGQPVSVVPDPWSCHESYSAHFVAGLHEGLAAVGAMPDETVYGHATYPRNEFADETAMVLDKLSEVRQILTEVGGRQLDEHWAPVQILDDQQNLRTRKFAGWDTERRLVKWRDRDGDTGTVGLDEGRLKLDWRLDWPARWSKWHVTVEPFGRDHATKGGSYQTGEVLVERIFGGRAPYPVPYEFINTAGETKKMSKSVGNVLTPKDALAVMPREILRYFVIKARPSRTLTFDSGLGLYTLIDEYSRDQSAGGTGAMAYAQAGSKAEIISRVPFNHLVAVYQAAREDTRVAREILERTGYADEVREQWPVIEREFGFVKNWLEKYAPESVKFAVKERLPQVELSAEQREFLLKLAETVETERDLNGQGMHDAIYAAAEVAGLKGAAAFRTLYQVLLGQDSGPKAGWFLASLEQDWLLRRLREAAEPAAAAEERPELSVRLPDGRAFTINATVIKAFPTLAVGYVVADVEVKPSQHDWNDLAHKELKKHGVEREALATEPRIKVWRAAYATFGVKPSDYRSSVEALVRRALGGKLPQINDVVDVYNYVSVKHLLPMGAMDLDQVEGDIELRFGYEGEKAQLLGMEKPVTVTSNQVVYADMRRVITWLWNHRDAKETAVREGTKRAVFFIDGLQEAASVEAAAEDLKTMLQDVFGAEIVASGVLAATSKK